MRFKQLDLNQLVCLDALLTEKSVTKAAQRLHLTQPAVSGALARMRDYFEDELFVQVGKRLFPTPLAQQLAKPVRDVLVQADAITTMRPSFDLQTTDRLITMCGSDYIGSTLVAQALRRIASVAPHLKLRWLQLEKHFLEEFEQGDTDILIIPHPYGSMEQPKERLIEDEYICVVCADNKNVGAELGLNQYLEMGHILTSAGSVRFPTYDEFVMQSLGYQRRIEVDAPTFSLVPQLVCGTNRVGTVLSRLAKFAAQSLPIRLLPMPIDLPPVVEYINYHRYQEFDPGLTWFRKVLHETAASLEPAGLPEMKKKKHIVSVKK